MAAARSTLLKEIKHEVAAWAEETKVLLSSCRYLIAYFGTDGETASWDAAIGVARNYIDVVVAAKKTSSKASLMLPGEVTSFECSEPVARIVAPLVHLIGGPVPTFVRTIRENGLSDDQKMLILAFGCFAARFGDCISEPLWQRYRHLAPNEWLELNPEPDPSIAGGGPKT
jgi:hypothetical protein